MNSSTLSEHLNIDVVTHLFITLPCTTESAEGEPSSVFPLGGLAASVVPSHSEVGRSGSSPASRSLMRGHHGARRESFLVSPGPLPWQGRAGEGEAHLGTRRAAGSFITPTEPHQRDGHPQRGGRGQFWGESGDVWKED